MTLEEFIGDPADGLTFQDTIYALYASLRDLKESKDKEAPKGSFSLVAGNCSCMIRRLQEAYPDLATQAEIEYELHRAQ